MRVHFLIGAAVLAIALLVVRGQARAQSPAVAQPSGPEILSFLNQSIAWYNQLPLEQQLATEPGDALFLSDDRQLAAQAVRLSFEFAKAEAANLARTPVAQTASAGSGQNSSGPARHQALINLTAKAEQQIEQAQQELAALRQKLETASGRKRTALLSAISETESEVQLAQTRRDVMRNILEFLNGSAGSAAGGSLRSQIEELERTVPVVAGSNANAQSSPEARSSVPPARRSEFSGILDLTTDLLSLSRKASALDDRIRSTDELAQSAKALRSPLGKALRELTKRGDELASQPDSSDPAVLARQKAELDNLTAQFKQGSDVMMPLIKQRVLLDLYGRSLKNWSDSIRNQYTAELKSLVLRLAVLAVVLALVIGASKVWTRTIYRYVQDPRRRHQLLVMRRIALWFVIAVIMAFAFATELGSLATFAGLITAGVAVALQTVLTSVAGYFFLIGRYGVRVGDRVQISGITGEVVDIGLVRLHLMELASSGSGAQATGRVVVFSNAVVFLPTGGFFKQIPGTNFVWHEISLTLAPESNYRGVEERLAGAVEAVFAAYRQQMEDQRRHMERTLGPVSVNPLGPESRLRLTEKGLEVVIRYPVEVDQAARIDDRITREVLDAIEREPKLRLVGTGTPNIQEVTNDGICVPSPTSAISVPHPR